MVLGSTFTGFVFLSVAVTWGSLGALVTGWGVGLGVGVGKETGLYNTPSSDHVAPLLSQVHLLGRGPSPLSFRGGRVARGDCWRP